jgi:hypothetical protein
VVLGVGAFGAAEVSAQQQTERQAKPSQPSTQASGDQKWEATKHLAVIDVGFEQAELNADMLKKLAAEPKAYDQMHGEVFLKNIQSALGDAQTHYGHLQPLARTADDRAALKQLGERITTALQMVQPLQQSIGDAAQTQKRADELENYLDKSERPVKQVAQQMDAQIDVG